MFNYYSVNALENNEIPGFKISEISSERKYTQIFSWILSESTTMATVHNWCRHHFEININYYSYLRNLMSTLYTVGKNGLSGEFRC